MYAGDYRITIAPAMVLVMAHKKGQGSSSNGRDSNAQRTGPRETFWW